MIAKDKGGAEEKHSGGQAAALPQPGQRRFYKLHWKRQAFRREGFVCLVTMGRARKPIHWPYITLKRDFETMMEMVVWRKSIKGGHKDHIRKFMQKHLETKAPGEFCCCHCWRGLAFLLPHSVDKEKYMSKVFELLWTRLSRPIFYDQFTSSMNAEHFTNEWFTYLPLCPSFLHQHLLLPHIGVFQKALKFRVWTSMGRTSKGLLTAALAHDRIQILNLHL